MNRNAVFAGLVGGLIAGVVFGVFMGALGMLPMVAKLIGSSSALVGFTVHLVLSALIGAGYGLWVSGRTVGFGTSFLAGSGYGALWWILGPLTLMPFLLGMGFGVNWSFAVAGKMVPSLFGHLLYGIVLAVTYAGLTRWEEARCA